MNDPRLARLATLLVDYSLGLREGEVVRVNSSDAAAPLILAVQRVAIERGVHAYANVALEGLAEILVAEGSKEQREFVSDLAYREVDRLDAEITIWSEANTKSFSRADPEARGQVYAAERSLVNRRWQRIARGEMRWVGTLMPTNAHAQDAEMSLLEYEDFVFRACHVDGDQDPVAHWRAAAKELTARAAEFADTREVRIVGPDTDLRLGVAGRTWQPSYGTHNMPDGEVFTSPVETETEGEIRFTLPAVFYGREVEDIRLRFEGGRVVDADARSGADYLRTLLDTDDGARVLGEFAFGLNYEIDRWTRNILFDEKIGGTVHLALGSGFDDCGSKNESALHWDIICDLREEGEIYADGELVWRAGGFLEAPKPVVEHV
ncbi:MAG TPA: aminopeptidase [Gaiellaceae bacterium]|nr:aminopeptidase [Gaiellaceae bacterium]